MSVKMGIKIDGLKRLRRSLDRMPVEMANDAREILREYGRWMADTMRKSIRNSSGAWREYRIDGNAHWSAFPHEPPNSATGSLARSIRLRRQNKKNWHAIQITVGADYAFWLEYGTRYMEPRPFVGPVYRQFSPMVTRDLNRMVERTIKGN